MTILRHDIAPASVMMRRLLKHLLRRWRIKCKAFCEDKRLFEQQQEIDRLRKIVDDLAAPVAAQSELLLQQAKRRER